MGSAERRLARGLRGNGWVLGLTALALALFPRLAGGAPLGIAAAAMSALVAFLALLASGHPSRFGSQIRLFVFGLVLVAAGCAWLAWRGEIGAAGGWTVAAIALVDAVVIRILQIAGEKEALGLTYYSPTEYRCLASLAEVIVMGEDEALTADEVGKNVDRYLGNFKAKSKWLSRLVFLGIEYYPLLTLRPPFSYLDPEARYRFIRHRFYRDVSTGLVPGFAKVLARAMIRMAKQLVYLGYYNDPRTYASIGYVPFSERPEAEERLRESPSVPAPRLEVVRAGDLGTERIDADVAIVGSGAAAGVLAYRLAQEGRSVVVLERGSHVEPSQFGEDEVEAFSNLFSDGALQMTRDFTYQVMQGSCVGGSTVVNNGVCFDLPDEVLRSWNDQAGSDARLDVQRLRDSFGRVRALMGVRSQDGRPLNRTVPRFLRGLSMLGLESPPHEIRTVDANINGCVGCGYCNLGCQFGKKLSMLITLLPRAQSEFGTDRMKIVSECTVRKLRHAGGTVRELEAQTSTGRSLRVRANTYVVAAGAVSSSAILLRSRLGGPMAGRGLSFNMASPMFGVLSERIDAYDGLQIASYCRQDPSTGYILETFAAPPVFTALAMPGWFEDHYRNMLSYPRVMTCGLLVGMKATGRVTLGGPILGRTIDYDVDPEDLQNMVQGLIKGGKLLFEAGAERVMPSTFTYHEFTSPEQLDRLGELVLEPGELAMGGGHPQGGNPISADPQRGVVGPDFRIHGTTNAFLCDASVFPTSVGVNPQLTVMALADYAAPTIARHSRTASTR